MRYLIKAMQLTCRVHDFFHRLAIMVVVPSLRRITTQIPSHRTVSSVKGATISSAPRAIIPALNVRPASIEQVIQVTQQAAHFVRRVNIPVRALPAALPLLQVTTPTAGGTLTSCAAGTYNPNSNQVSCPSCPSGRANPSIRQQSCQYCTTGRYQPNGGQHSCAACPTGKSGHPSYNSRNHCLTCPKGYYSDVAGAGGGSSPGYGCKAAAPGYYQDLVGQSGQKDCLAGTYTGASVQTQCSQCEMGRSQAEDRKGACDVCATGKYQNVMGQTTCTVCMPGRIAPASETENCALCAEGRFQGASEQTTCGACAPGYWTSAAGGASACEACTPGRVWIDGNIGCQDCGIGRYSSATAYISVPTDPVDCTATDAGSFANVTGTVVPLNCAPGDVQPLSGRTVCDQCAAGRAADVPTNTCYDCAVGEYSPISAPVCTLCELGSASNSMAIPDGCAPCAQGKHQNVTGMTSCRDCVPGRASVGGLTDCTICQPGTFAEVLRTVTCDECDAGRHQSFEDQSTCVDCEAGRSRSFDAAPECAVCDPGRFIAVAGVHLACDVCPVGSITNVTGQSSCIACSPGRFSSNHAVPTLCTACAVGHFSDTHAGACTPCIGGKFANVTGTPIGECLLCVPGKFVDDTSNTVCHECPPGRADSRIARAACDVCATGRRQNASGTLDCIDVWPARTCRRRNTPAPLARRALRDDTCSLLRRRSPRARRAA
jgi:hypothetical protein